MKGNILKASIRKQLQDMSTEKNILIMKLVSGWEIIGNVVESKKIIKIYNPLSIGRLINEAGESTIILTPFAQEEMVAHPHMIVKRKHIFTYFLPTEKFSVYYLESVNKFKLRKAKKKEESQKPNNDSPPKVEPEENKVVSLLDYKKKKNMKSNAANNSTEFVPPDDTPPEPPSAA